MKLLFLQNHEVNILLSSPDLLFSSSVVQVVIFLQPLGNVQSIGSSFFAPSISVDSSSFVSHVWLNSNLEWAQLPAFFGSSHKS